MNKKEIKEYFRSKCPDIPFLRKYFTKKRIEKFKAGMLSADEISQGENSFEKKQAIVEANSQKSPRFIKYTIKSMEYLFSRAPEYQTREDKDALRIDILFCRFAYGFQPDEYLCFELEHKSAEERKAFVSDVERLCYAYRMNDLFEIPNFNNKAKTYAIYKPYYQREAIAIRKPADYAAFQQFIQKHPVFVKKAVYESMGRSIELIDVNSSSKTARQLFDEWTAQGLHILEERVVQSKATAVLNESSVNTVRCITMKTKHGIENPYCFMKIGRAGSFVDNGGAGGILVGIDKATGVFNTDGFDELNIRYEQHPDSGIVFKGFQLPEWDSMLALCMEMSAKMDKVKYIGWDMAYTDKGWVVIEGNGISQMIGPQIVWKYGIKAEIEKLLSDMDLMA